MCWFLVHFCAPNCQATDRIKFDDEVDAIYYFYEKGPQAIAPLQNRKPHFGCCWWAAGHGLLLLFVRFIFPCFIAPLLLVLEHPPPLKTHTHNRSGGDRIFPLTCPVVQLHLSTVTVAECPTWCSHQPVLALSVIYDQLPPSQTSFKVPGLLDYDVGEYCAPVPFGHGFVTSFL